MNTEVSLLRYRVANLEDEVERRLRQLEEQLRLLEERFLFLCEDVDKLAERVAKLEADQREDGRLQG